MIKGKEIETLINQMADQIDQHQLESPLFVGIRTGGVWIAEKLHDACKAKEPLGILDISFYRDDFSTVGLNPQVKASDLPVPVENRNIVLVDDVLYTGRTIRAALNELFSYGRPASVLLAVLIDRPGRQLPIQAGVFGRFMDIESDQHVQLAQVGSKLEVRILSLETKDAE